MSYWKTFCKKVVASKIVPMRGSSTSPIPLVLAPADSHLFHKWQNIEVPKRTWKNSNSCLTIILQFFENEGEYILWINDKFCLCVRVSEINLNRLYVLYIGILCLFGIRRIPGLETCPPSGAWTSIISVRMRSG